jgi:hypothetical protein
MSSDRQFIKNPFLRSVKITTRLILNVKLLNTEKNFIRIGEGDELIEGGLLRGKIADYIRYALNQIRVH